MIKREIHLVCDGCSTEIGPNQRVSNLRELAKKLGWVRRRGLDYCEKCAKRMPTRAQKRAWLIV